EVRRERVQRPLPGRYSGGPDAGIPKRSFGNSPLTGLATTSQGRSSRVTSCRASQGSRTGGDSSPPGRVLPKEDTLTPLPQPILRVGPSQAPCRSSGITVGLSGSPKTLSAVYPPSSG